MSGNSNLRAHCAADGNMLEDPSRPLPSIQLFAKTMHICNVTITSSRFVCTVFSLHWAVLDIDHAPVIQQVSCRCEATLRTPSFSSSPTPPCSYYPRPDTQYQSVPRGPASSRGTTTQDGHQASPFMPSPPHPGREGEPPLGGDASATGGAGLRDEANGMPSQMVRALVPSTILLSCVHPA